MKANQLFLNRACEVWVASERSAAPLGTKTVEQAAEALATHGADLIVVEFRTSEAGAARDLVTYTKRLSKVASLAGYKAGIFAPKVVRDCVLPTVYVATLTR